MASIAYDKHVFGQDSDRGYRGTNEELDRLIQLLLDRAASKKKAAKLGKLVGEEAVDVLHNLLNSGASGSLEATFTARKRANYEMFGLEHGEGTAKEEGRDMTVAVELPHSTSPIHASVSMAFISCLPRYNLTETAKDIFFVIVGSLAQTDSKGRYIYLNTYGEVQITQQRIADVLGIHRTSVARSIPSLVDRGFCWPSGRGKYQIHPHILYFGSADNQQQAIGYATGNHPSKRLPTIPTPGTPVFGVRRNPERMTASGKERKVRDAGKKIEILIPAA
jgi:biotin operon repressor